MQNEGAKLAAKLVKVMQAVGYIPKSGKNLTQNYTYATDAEISDKVREAMAEARVVMLPRVTAHGVRQIATAKGNTLNINTVQMDFTFIDADSGEAFTVSTVGEGMDSGDKGVYKAMTGATKYALLKSFQIPTGDDPEKDNGDDETRNAPHASAQGAPKPAAEPPPSSPPPASTSAGQVGTKAAPPSNTAVQSQDAPAAGGISDPQRKMIYAVSQKLGLDREYMVDLLSNLFGKDDSRKLTRIEATSLITRLKEMEAQWATGMPAGGCGA